MAKGILDILGKSTPVSEAIAKELKYVRAAISCRVFFYQQLDDGLCRATTATLAEKLGMSQATISENLAWLVENEYIAVVGEHKSGNKPNRYRVTSKFLAILDKENDENNIRQANDNIREANVLGGNIREANDNIWEANDNIREANGKEVLKESIKEVDNNYPQTGNKKPDSSCAIAPTILTSSGNGFSGGGLPAKPIEPGSGKTKTIAEILPTAIKPMVDLSKLTYRAIMESDRGEGFSPQNWQGQIELENGRPNPRKMVLAYLNKRLSGMGHEEAANSTQKRGDLFIAVCEICSYNPKVLTPKMANQVNLVVDFLLKRIEATGKDVSPETVSGFVEYFNGNDWRAKNGKIEPGYLPESWECYAKWVQAGKPANKQSGKNGYKTALEKQKDMVDGWQEMNQIADRVNKKLSGDEWIKIDEGEMAKHLEDGTLDEWLESLSNRSR